MENFLRSAVCYIFLFGGACIGSFYILSDMMNEKRGRPFLGFLFMGFSYAPFWYSVENGYRISYALLHVLFPPMVSILTLSIAYKIFIHFSTKAFLEKKESEMTKKDHILLSMMVIVVFVAFSFPLILFKYRPLIK